MNKNINKIQAIVLTGYGLNCDHETAYSLELAGAVAHRIHINSLIDGTTRLDEFQIMVFGGGFSWGDDHGAGVIQAVRMKNNIGDKLLEFIEKENLVIGICNGFQTLVNLGLLPGLDGDYVKRTVALTFNDCGKFRDDWVHLKVNTDSPCIFTKGLEKMELPIRHGEGKFYSDKSVIDRLIHQNQVVLSYAMPDGTQANQRFPFNPNGSVADIAGICDPTGKIFGLMPHPEAYNHFVNHPNWTRKKEIMKRSGAGLWEKDSESALGIRIFQNAINYFYTS